MSKPKQPTRPCDACRRRKIKCLYASEEADQCILCHSRSTACTFVDGPPVKKRALSYSKESSRSPKQQETTIILDGRTPISDYSSLSGPTLLKRTLGHQNRQSSSYLGITSEHDLIFLEKFRFDRNGEYRTNVMSGILRRVDQQAHYLMRVDAPTEMEEELQSLDQIEAIIKPHGPALVKSYFRIVHPSFPIIHKKVFLEKYGRTYRELTPLGLAAVYLLALDWWNYSRDLASLQKPNVKELERLVGRIMANMHNRAKISDVQACLVIAQRTDGDSWARTGLLVGMGQTLGVHLDCSNWSIPEWEKGVRKRIAWALFMQDKWGALIYGRPSHITQDNWEVTPIAESDFPETAQDDDDEEGSSEIEEGKQIFIAMISLTEILSDIMDSLFTLKVVRSNLNTTEVLQRAKPLQIRLKHWYSELSPSLAMGRTKTGKLSAISYLHLAYFAAEVTLHRAVIHSHRVSDPDEEIRSITRVAARARFKSAVEFAKRIKPEHLQSFWYFASKHNLSIIGTFGIILWLTSSDNEERDFYAAQLAEYRWMLRISSTSAEFMKHAVTFLDVCSASQTNPDSNTLARIRPNNHASGEVVTDQSATALHDYMSSHNQLDWLHNLNQNFDISFDDLAGYSVQDFMT